MLSQRHYREVGIERLQVIDIGISLIVTESRAQILENLQCRHFIVPIWAHIIKMYNKRLAIN